MPYKTFVRYAIICAMATMDRVSLKKSVRLRAAAPAPRLWSPAADGPPARPAALAALGR